MPQPPQAPPRLAETPPPVPRLELDQLAALDRIAREGSFSRAALALGIGQPAVSGRIAALEQAVGGQLFHRGRRTSLTALGESLLPFARRALEVLREGVEAARMAQVGERGRVRLGVLGSLAGGLAGPALGRFLRARPEVDCVLRSGDHETLLELLFDGLVDLAWVAWPAPGAPPGELTPLLVFHEPVVPVASPAHPLAARGAVTPAELALLARPLHKLRWWPAHHPRIERLAALGGRTAEVAMEAALHLVLAGTGAGFFNRTLVAGALRSGALRQLRVRGFAPLYRDSALVRRKRSAPLSPAAAALIQELRAELRAASAPSARRAPQLRHQ